MTGRSFLSRRWSNVQSARRGTNVSGAVPKRQKYLGIESVCRLLKGKKKKGPLSPIRLGRGEGEGEGKFSYPHFSTVARKVDSITFPPTTKEQEGSSMSVWR